MSWLARIIRKRELVTFEQQRRRHWVQNQVRYFGEWTPEVARTLRREN